MFRKLLGREEDDAADSSTDSSGSDQDEANGADIDESSAHVAGASDDVLESTPKCDDDSQSIAARSHTIESIAPQCDDDSQATALTSSARSNTRELESISLEDDDASVWPGNVAELPAEPDLDEVVEDATAAGAAAAAAAVGLHLSRIWKATSLGIHDEPAHRIASNFRHACQISVNYIATPSTLCNAKPLRFLRPPHDSHTFIARQWKLRES